MSDDKNIDINVRVQKDGVQSGLKAVEDAVSHTTTYLRTNLGGIGNIVERIKIPFQELGEVLAGAFAIKEIEGLIGKTEELGLSLNKASQQTGMTTEQLSGLKYAAEQVDVSFETVTKGMERLALGMQTSVQSSTSSAGKALKELGISATDSSGRLKPLDQITFEVADKMHDMQGGAGKTAIMMQLYGRSGAELIPVMNLGGAAIRGMTDDTKAMGAAVGKDLLEKIEAFHQSMGRVGLVGQALGNVLSGALMPALTLAANAFADSAREGGVLYAAIQVLGRIVQEVATAFIVVTATIQQLGEIGVFVFNELAEFAEGSARAISDAMHGNLARAAADMKVTSHAMQGEFDGMVRGLVKSSQDAAAAWLKVIGLGADDSPAKPKNKPPPVAGVAKSQLPEWREEWETIKEGQGAFAGDLKQMELDFWTEKLAIATKGSKDYIAIHHQIVSLEQGIAKDNFATQMATYKLEEDAARGNAAKILVVRQEELAAVREHYAEQSKEVQNALRNLEQAEEAHRKQGEKAADDLLTMQRDHALAGVSLEQESIDLKQQLGEISDAEALKRTKDLLDREYQLKRDALTNELALAQDDNERHAQLLAQLQALDDQHAAVIQKNADATVLAVKSQWEGIFSSITNAFQTSVTGILQGTQTLRGALSNLGVGILGDFVSMGVKKLASHIATEIGMTQATVAGDEARSTSNSWGAVQSVAAGAWAALKNIANYALQAIAGAWAAISSIPYVGPFLAPAVAVGVGAAVFALGSQIVSAEGGYDIPAGVNPVTQLHAREMVLPAAYADVIRGLGSAGGASGSTDSGDHHYHIHAVDAASFHALLTRNPAAVAAGVKQAVRDGHLPRPA